MYIVSITNPNSETIWEFETEAEAREFYEESKLIERDVGLEHKIRLALVIEEVSG